MKDFWTLIENNNDFAYRLFARDLHLKVVYIFKTIGPIDNWCFDHSTRARERGIQQLLAKPHKQRTIYCMP